MARKRAVDRFARLLAGLALAAVCLRDGQAEADRKPDRPAVTNSQLLHGWTFTLQPREASPSLDQGPENPASMADIRAIAFEPQATLFGGVLRGRFAIGGRVLRPSAGPRGFVVRLRRSGQSELVRLWEGQSPALTALLSTATGRILAGSNDGGLWEMTSSGRVLWSLPGLASPAAIAILDDGDVVTGGCERWTDPPVVPGAPPEERIGSGYIARITPDGRTKWRFTFGENRATTFPKSCVTGVALGPSGDIFAVGLMGTDIAVGADTLRASAGNQFVTRFSADGVPRWTKLLPISTGGARKASKEGQSQALPANARPSTSCLEAPRLAIANEDGLAIVGNVVASQPCGTAGLAFFRFDGALRWLLPVDKPPSSAAFSDVTNALVVEADRSISWAASFTSAIRIGEKSLDQAANPSEGIFLANLTPEGRVTSLERIPSGVPAQGGVPPGLGAIPSAMAAVGRSIWIGGRVEAADSAFLYRAAH